MLYLGENMRAYLLADASEQRYRILLEILGKLIFFFGPLSLPESPLFPRLFLYSNPKPILPSPLVLPFYLNT